MEPTQIIVMLSIILAAAIVLLVRLLMTNNELTHEVEQAYGKLNKYVKENADMIGEITKARMMLSGLEDQLKTTRKQIASMQTAIEMHLEEITELKNAKETKEVAPIVEALKVPEVPEVSEVSKVLEPVATTVATPKETTAPPKSAKAPRKNNRRKK